MTRLGPFDLDRPVAKGGMAEVWLARHREQGVPVAVKVMTGCYARQPEFVRRFGDEVRAVAALDHPGVVMVLDHGRIDAAAAAGSDRLVEGCPWLAMEFASGGTLAHLGGPLPWPMLKGVLLALLDALAHAHAREVVHRDLKPANVLVSASSDPRPGIKLSDFGIAWAGGLPDEAEARGEAIVGTPTYMAPEQIRGDWRDFGPWTDLYAFGCLVWWLTTGRTPFGGDTTRATLLSQLQREPPELAARMPVPDGFEGWVRRLLAKSIPWRFQRAADAAWALTRLGEPEPTRGADEAWELDEGFHESLTATQITFGESWRLSLDEPSTPIDDEPQLDDGAPRPAPIPSTWKHPVPNPPPMQLVGAGLSLYGLRAVRLVGREEERSLLWRELREVARTGRARLVLIEGPAGTGKSRLVEWLGRRGHELGAVDRCKATFSPEKAPGEALRQMGNDYLRLAGLQRVEVAARVHGFLDGHGVDDEAQEAVLVELLCPASEADVARGARPVRLTRPREYYAGTRETMRLLAARRPLVAWLDDVQWGLHGLGLALQILRTQDEHAFPCLLVLTMRTEDLDDTSDEARRLAQLMDLSDVTRIRLGPLPTSAHQALVRGLLGLDDELAARIEERTDGNPLFAVQLVGSWVQRGILEVGPTGFRLTPGVRPDLPDDLHAVWSAHIDRILGEFSPRAATWLEVAACLGQTVSRDEWRRACDDPEGLFGDRFPGDEPLRTALVDRLLVQRLAVGTREQWSLVHGMLRESLERTAREAGRWRQHHESCAAMLRARGDDERVAERLGRHLLAAGQRDDALDPLLRGVERRLVTAGPQPAQALLGRIVEAMRAPRLPSSDARWGRAWTLQARVSHELGQLERAQRQSQRALLAAERHGWTEVRLRALEMQARLLVDLRRPEEAAERWQVLLDQGQRAGDQARVGVALAGLAEVDRRGGDPARAAERLDRALDALDRGGAPSEAAAALVVRGRCAEAVGDRPRARACYREALLRYEQLGSGLGAAEAHDRLARLSFDAGALREARDAFQRALSRYEALGSERALACRMRLARTLLDLGAPDAMWEVVEGVQPALARLDHPSRVAAGLGVQALRAALDGARDATEEAVAQMSDHPARSPQDRRVVAWLAQLIDAVRLTVPR